MQTKDNASFYIVAVKGWVEKDGKFLLARRGPEELHMPGVWSIPGGKVDAGPETIRVLEMTLTKEVEEEVGITVSDDMQLIYNNSFKRSDDTLVVGLTFLCRYESGNAEALEDTTEIAWHTIEELKQLPDLEEFLKREINILAEYLAD